jgi:PAS domain S-box-containing protein
VAGGGDKTHRELVQERDLLGTALAESERITAGILSAVPAGVVHVTADGAIKTANDEALRILGLSFDELTQRYTMDFEPETIFEDGSPCTNEDYPVTQAIVTGEPQPPMTIGVGRPDGAVSWCIFRAIPVKDDAGATTGAVVTITDITARKRSEVERTDLLRRLHDAQRLEALGRLAGGVAHDFNNLLTVILGSLDLEERHLSGELSKPLLAIRGAANQAAHLTRQLLAFGRRQALAPRTFCLATKVHAMQPVLQRLVGETVEVKVLGKRNGCEVHVDPNEMERVVVNLVANARDAMPDGGVVRVTLDHGELTDGDHATGRYVALSVSDSGAGIDEAIREQIFEPFVTTKGGKGTGLGLATVHGVVTQSGGTVRVDSAQGEGTTFHVFLPSVESSQQPDGEDPEPRSIRGRGERILLVEDEVAVRRVVRMLLEESGFVVDAATSSKSALELDEGALEGLDLLLTDVVMPGHTGTEVAQAFADRRPSLPVLFMSGHLEDQLRALPEDADLLQKPFTADALLERVRAAIDRGKG